MYTETLTDTETYRGICIQTLTDTETYRGICIQTLTDADTQALESSDIDR